MTTPIPTPSAPESIVTDLEHAKMLKEAGWPQGNQADEERCIFYWYNRIAPRNSWEIIASDSIRGLVSKYEIAAPTAEEILRTLPAIIKTEPEESGVEIVRGVVTDQWCVRLRTFNAEPHGDIYCTKDSSLANAASQMYAYLAKNGLLPKEA